MIPRIQGISAAEPRFQNFIDALKGAGFKGDLDKSHSGRLLCATDNSVYQCMPQAVIFPRDADDISLAFKIAKRPGFENLIFTPRGGGTGTNGQSLNRGITIDMSRYMKNVGELDLENHSLWVQCGCIKDEINEQLKPHGLFFSPELSTSNRATIGGMISNDAAGQGSLKYGRTSTHILRVKVVLVDGTITEFGPVKGAQLKECLNKDGLEGEIYRTCYQLLKNNRGDITKHFPKLNRFMTGYDLAHAYDPRTGILNLARLICGAEGTLATVYEAQLDLTSIPTFRELMVVKYENFDAALRHAVKLVDAGVLSVETVDSKVLNLARQDVVWNEVKEYIQDVPNHEIQGINIVEFAGYDADEEHQRLNKLFDDTQKNAESFKNGILGAQIASSPKAIAAIYGMRKKAVGLLGAAAGRRKLVAFTEDTVVPPKHLADYILEFRALLDGMSVPYGMFGHVDTGLMHVRPALDLTSQEDREKLVAISNAVVDLVSKYQGQMWGEHGRGYRSCFGERFFGKLYPIARQIKEVFDKDNILNPGKICIPFSNDIDKLVAIDGPMRGDLDRTLPVAVRENFKGALSCNGNGQCFSYQKSSLMCPSYRYTKNHVNSPKGYSELAREWLRLLNDQGCNPNVEETQALTAIPNPIRFLKRVYNTLNKKDDYSLEYLEHIKTCLSCKSCKSICPAHVNAADLNSRFLSLYYGRYLRPTMDLLVLNAERFVPLMAKWPKYANMLVQNKLSTYLCEKLIGMVDLPKFSEKPLSKLCAENGFELLSTAKALKDEPEVLIVTDPFTAAYEAEGLMMMARVMRELGYRVALLKPYINGKLMVIRGDRRAFVHYAVKQAARLERLSRARINLVGFDPALTICYRDEYVQLLKEMRGNFEVMLPEEWFEKQLGSLKLQNALSSLQERLQTLKSQDEKLFEPYYLFTHCTERALVPKSVTMWQMVMQAFNLPVIPVAVACCGMAGLHGHMVQNQDETYKVYEQNWKGEIAKRPFDHCLITGFSCRSQVERMEHKKPVHPLLVLDEILKRINA